MRLDGPIYRPPLEANTIILQVTRGCSHNSCKYCNMYRSTSFKVSPISEIEEDLLAIKLEKPDTDRLFLHAGDAFVLSFSKLKKIAETINEFLPKMKTITMYASINNIFNKSVEELKILKNLGINYLYIGLETGDDKTLLTQNMGYTTNEALEQLKKLEEAGIGYLTAYILGAGGDGNGEENALQSAKFFNQIKPNIIWTMNLIVFEGTPLHEDVKNGVFTESSELEKMKELKLFLENIDNEAHLISAHGSNLIDVSGYLPKDKDKMIEKLQQAINDYDPVKMQRMSDIRRF